MKFINYTLQQGDTVEDRKYFKIVYNDQGKEVYFENNNGYWRKREYNAQGQVVYFEDSRGEWQKCEFNAQGLEIYYEDSYGVIRDKRKEGK